MFVWLESPNLSGFKIVLALWVFLQSFPMILRFKGRERERKTKKKKAEIPAFWGVSLLFTWISDNVYTGHWFCLRTPPLSFDQKPCVARLMGSLGQYFLLHLPRAPWNFEAAAPQTPWQSLVHGCQSLSSKPYRNHASLLLTLSWGILTSEDFWVFGLFWSDRRGCWLFAEYTRSPGHLS